MISVQGWSGLLLAYASVQVPLTVTLLSRRAGAAKLLTAPLLGVPLTVVAGVTIAALSPLAATAGLSGSRLAQLGIGLFGCCAVGFGAARALTRRAKEPQNHRRGTRVEPDTAGGERIRGLDGARPPESARDCARRSSTLGHHASITLAGIPIGRHDETKHFKLIGTTGTGKSTAIREILGRALERGDRAIIADPDGGYLERFAQTTRGDLVLNPFDSRSRRWDLFGEIDSAYDVDQLARSLITEHGGPDRSWTAYARTFFSAVTRQAHEAGVRDVSELYRLLVVAEAVELRQLLNGTPAQPFLEPHNARMFDSIRSVASSAVASLEYVAQQRAAPLSVRQWVREGAGAERSSGVLFLPYRAGQIASLRSSISAWMRLAIFEAMDQPETDQRLWFIVDELDALGPIDGLKDALARLRKFGGRCVLGLQSIAQVSATYGSGEAQTIVENCGNTLILRCSSSEHGGTASFASRLIGQREVLRMSTSRSRRPGELFTATTVAEHLHIEPAVMDSEIEQLPDLQGYLKLASSPGWRRINLTPESGAWGRKAHGAPRPAHTRTRNAAHCDDHELE